MASFLSNDPGISRAIELSPNETRDLVFHRIGIRHLPNLQRIGKVLAKGLRVFMDDTRPSSGRNVTTQDADGSVTRIEEPMEAQLRQALLESDTEALVDVVENLLDHATIDAVSDLIRVSVREGKPGGAAPGLVAEVEEDVGVYVQLVQGLLAANQRVVSPLVEGLRAKAPGPHMPPD